MRKGNFAKAIAILTAVSMVTAVPMASFATETGSDEPVESVVASGNDKITVKGDVDNHNGKAVEVSANKGNDASVTIEGKITSTTDDKQNKYTSSALNIVKVTSDGGKASSTLNDIFVETDLNSNDFKNRKLSYATNGIYESSSNNGSSSVTVNGNIDVTASSTTDDSDSKSLVTTATGVNVKADYNATSDAVINGNINVNSNVFSAGVTINAGDNSNKSTGTVNVTINGDISSTRTGISSGELGNNYMTVNGNIVANSLGVRVHGDENVKDSVNGTANVTVNGDVSSHNEGISIIDVNNKASVTVDGNVKSDNSGICLYHNYGDVTIITDGTVSGDKTAIFISNEINRLEQEYIKDSEDDEYTLSYTGGTVDSKTDAPNITVWKLESSSSKLITAETDTYHYKKDNNGKLILDDEGQPIVDGEDEMTTTENKTLADKVAKAINYIIKGSVSENGKDTTNGKIVLKGTSGTVTVGDKTYQTAHQDETITINVETISGYKYSLKNGEALLKANTDGTYTLKVPAGGGVDLRAVLEKIQESNSNNNNSSSSSSNSSSNSGNKNNSSSGSKTNGSSSGNRSSSSGGSGSGSSGLSTGSYVVVGSNGVPNTKFTSIISTPGAWSKDAGNNWIYVNASGSSYKNDWIAAGNRWYYLNDKGNPMTGWQLIKGVWYYFAATDTTANPLGSMYVSATTPDGYKVDVNGAYVK